MDHTFTLSSNDPYTINTNLKGENRNILQITQKKISTISLARQLLIVSKVSFDAWSSVHSEGQTSSEYSETFKEIRNLCDQKLEKVCHVVSLLIDCEAHMSTLDFVPQVLMSSPSTVKLLSISAGKRRTFSTMRDRPLRIAMIRPIAISSENFSPSIWKKLLTSRNY